MAISEKRKIGNYGEDLACGFLKEKGLYIAERNYLRKWGELDIIAFEKSGFLFKKLEKIHFVEVKTVSCEKKKGTNEQIISNYLLSDNIHKWKVQRISRVLQTYFMEEKVSPETKWQFDIIIVFINLKDMPIRHADIGIKDIPNRHAGKSYHVEYFKNVII